MGMLNDYRAILRVTTLQRDARTFKLLVMMGLPLTLCLALVGGIALWEQKMGLDLSLRMLGGLATLWFLLVWCILFVPGTLMLNSAVNARLMPRQRRRVIQMTAGCWLLLTAVSTAVLGKAVAFPLVGMLVLGLAMTFSGNMGGIFLIVLPSNWPVAARYLVPPPWLEVITSMPGLVAATALTLLGVAWALRAMYPAGGDIHLGKRAHQVERIRRMQSGEGWTQGVDSGTFNGSSALRLYAYSLRRDCRAPRPGAMLMHALGPGAHWSIWILSLAIMLAVGAAIHVLVAWHDTARARDFMAGLSMSGLGGMVSMILFSTAQIGQSINKTLGEQALLRLTPLAGDKGLLNERLARQLVLRGLSTWVLLTGAVMVLTLMVGGTDALARQFALCSLAGQVSMMGLLCDYARDGGWTLARALRAGGLALLEVGAGVGAGWLTGTSYWSWMTAIAIAACVFLLRRAWHGMLAAPPAFPARRLALS